MQAVAVTSAPSLMSGVDWALWQADLGTFTLWATF